MRNIAKPEGNRRMRENGQNNFYDVALQMKLKKHYAGDKREIPLRVIINK